MRLPAAEILGRISRLMGTRRVILPVDERRENQEQEARWREIQQRLLPEVSRFLRGGLVEAAAEGRWRFARMDDVLALVARQFSYGALSLEILGSKLPDFDKNSAQLEAWIVSHAEQLAQEALESDVVWDCEKAAEYLSPNTNSARRDEILAHFWHWTKPWLTTVACGMLKKYGRGLQPTPAQTQDVASQVTEKVFTPEGFRSCLSRYEPAKGLTFDQFLKRRLVWRSIDAAKMILNEPPTIDPDALEELALPKECIDEVVQPEVFAANLKTCIARLEALRADGNPSLNHQCALVFQLRLKAYLDPDDFADYTREALGTALLARLREEYRELQQEYKTLAGELLPALRQERIYRRLEEEKLRRTMRINGCKPSKLEDLADKGRHQRIGVMEKHQAKLFQAGASASTLTELDFMIACARHNNARIEFDKSDIRVERFKRCKLPWVRSEPDISRLTGVPQPTVSRRLKTAEDFLRDRATEE